MQTQPASSGKRVSDQDCCWVLDRADPTIPESAARECPVTLASVASNGAPPRPYPRASASHDAGGPGYDRCDHQHLLVGNDRIESLWEAETVSRCRLRSKSAPTSDVSETPVRDARLGLDSSHKIRPGDIIEEDALLWPVRILGVLLVVPRPRVLFHDVIRAEKGVNRSRLAFLIIVLVLLLTNAQLRLDYAMNRKRWRRTRSGWRVGMGLVNVRQLALLHELRVVETHQRMEALEEELAAVIVHRAPNQRERSNRPEHQTCRREPESRRNLLSEREGHGEVASRVDPRGRIVGHIRIQVEPLPAKRVRPHGVDREEATGPRFEGASAKIALAPWRQPARQ